MTTSVAITKRHMTSIDSDPDFSSHNTIPKLFDRICDAIRDRADVIEVTYNPSLGYPMDVCIDPSLKGLDDSHIFGVSDLHILEGGEQTHSSN